MSNSDSQKDFLLAGLFNYYLWYFELKSEWKNADNWHLFDIKSGIVDFVNQNGSVGPI